MGSNVEEFPMRSVRQGIMQKTTEREKRVSETDSSFLSRFAKCVGEVSKQNPEWNKAEYVGLFSLILLWFLVMRYTWANWGNLTVDCGREMYVARVLSEGKVLYRDVWYLYGPAAPYFNALLFKLFGVRLTVLYMAGSIAALGSAIFLYLSGIELAFPLAGWSAGCVLLFQAFLPDIFCFPLPYSFAAVYGCLVSCLFVWSIIKASRSSSERWLFIIGLLAGLAMLLKLEHGIACYGTVVLILLLRAFRSGRWERFARDSVVMIPGMAICVAVIVWMVQLRGVRFITDENIMSWPTSFFMKTYGTLWLAQTGLALDKNAVLIACGNTLSYGAMMTAAYLVFTKRRDTKKLGMYLLVPLLIALALVPSLWRDYRRTFLSAFYPEAMVLYVALGAMMLLFITTRRWSEPRTEALALAAASSSALAARFLISSHEAGYGIYYEGPTLLCMLIFMALIVRTLKGQPLAITSAERFFCFACMGIVLVRSAHFKMYERPVSVPLTTDFGMVRTTKDVAEGYTNAIAFMKEKAAQHESVLSIPEDTSLYFLSGSECPLRVFAFTPGVVAPGRMTQELMDELDRSRPSYLLWSNRMFPEYGVAQFGIDFDQKLGVYFRSHYQPAEPPQVFGVQNGWHAVVWERRSAK